MQITVQPGVTAAQAVAARAGAPLGGDYAVLSLSDRLKSWSVIEARLRAVGAADLALAIYNPASRTRRHQVKEAKEILLEFRAGDTPAIIGRSVGRPDESVTVTTLGDLDPDLVDMSCLLIIGSSRTVTSAGRGLDLAPLLARAVAVQVGLDEVRRLQHPADHDHRRLPETRPLHLVGDVGQGAAQDQLAGLGGPGHDRDRTVGHRRPP